MTRRVLCIEDQQAFRDALRIAISCEDDLECIGAAGDVPAGMELLASEGADIVVMDFDLPGVDGIEGIRRAKALDPDIRVVLLTALGDVATFARAVAVGVDAFVLKDQPLDVIVEALRDDRRVGPHLDPETVRQLRARVRPRGRGAATGWSPDLTDREREVLSLLAVGIDAQTIAGQLGIRVHTCRGYVKNVLYKLGAHSQLEAVAIALRLGILVDEAPPAASSA